MSTTEIDIHERLLVPTRAGEIVFDYRKCAFLPECESLLLADLHFEKGSYLQAKGHAPVPTYDTKDTLLRLKGLIEAYKPKRVIILGDSFHDIAAGQRMSSANFENINNMIANVSDFIWILGNHDPDIPKGLKGTQEDHVQIGEFLLTHLPVDAGNGVNVCGHLHPKIRVKTSRRTYWLPCFARSEARIILPSFGTFTGGLDVTHEAIKKELQSNSFFFAIGPTGLVGLPSAYNAT